MGKFNPAPGGMVCCKGCYEKQLKIDRLEEQVTQLKAKIAYQKKKQYEGLFGSNTPSAKIPVKANVPTNEAKKKSGAKDGHVGHGRHGFLPEDADEIVDEGGESGESCEFCGGTLELKEIRHRSILDLSINAIKKILIRRHIKRCKCCKKKARPRNKMAVFPRYQYGNALIAQTLVNHYCHGFPLRRLEYIMGVSPGALMKIFHKIGAQVSPLIPMLEAEYRLDPVIHADETTWRTKGKNGYVWLFCSPSISLFYVENTRSSQIPKNVLGELPLLGVLVVDRYAGYNRMLIKIQYCFAHLLRELIALGKDFPDYKAVQVFVNQGAPLLSEAMKLQQDNIPDEQYYVQAKSLKQSIQILMLSDSGHFVTQAFQGIFVEQEHRLYHWVDDRRVPAHNNRSEREVRSTVIARKVSFGSQSEQGAKTRSIWMSILHTAKKRLPKGQSLQEWLLHALNTLALDPNINIGSFLPDSS
jgi:transposase